ncbi:1928_t:CDS:2, partial [Gigaspora margarita]
MVEPNILDTQGGLMIDTSQKGGIMIDTSQKGGLMVTIKECASGTVSGIVQVLVGQGTTIPLVGMGACVSIQFAGLENMKRFFNEINERNGNKTSVLTNSQLFLSGATAGIANSIISGPIEHIRTRLQVQITPTPSNSSAKKFMLYSGPIDCIKKIYSSYGIRGIYKGQMITMVREFQGFGTYFFLYEFLKRMDGKGREIESWKAYLFGALA